MKYIYIYIVMFATNDHATLNIIFLGSSSTGEVRRQHHSSEGVTVHGSSLGFLGPMKIEEKYKK